LLPLKVAANGTAAAAKKLVYPAGNGAVPAVTDADVIKYIGDAKDDAVAARNFWQWHCCSW
jgi:hypothetical protein